MDHTVFIGFQGKMTKVANPKGNCERANFVITFKGRDWSGFRTLEECQKQFPALEEKSNIEEFAVVER